MSESTLFLTYKKLEWNDLAWATVLTSYYVLHVVIILRYSTPFGWFCCCLFPPLDTDGWIVVATLILGSMWVQAARKRLWTPSNVAARIVLSLLLIGCGSDLVTGGNERWFTIALNRDLRACGGPGELQAWAERFLAPDHLNPGRDDIQRTELPPPIRTFAQRFRMTGFYQRGEQSWISFQEESAYIGYGVIVGRSDLDPQEFGLCHQRWVVKAGAAWRVLLRKPLIA